MATLPLADVVDGLVVHHEGTVGVLQGGVGTQGGVLGFHHGRGHLIERRLLLMIDGKEIIIIIGVDFTYLGGGVDAELQLGLLP